jgi:hypothetical protein
MEAVRGQPQANRRPTAGRAYLRVALGDPHELRDILGGGWITPWRVDIPFGSVAY